MQPRLMRSRTESILAGVCGGLGDYFGVDPVIVRLIFVLVTLTTGIGLVVYPVLWLVMPRAPEGAPYPPQGVPPQLGADEFGATMSGQASPYVMQEARLRGQPTTASRTAAPPPEAYNFDPLTGLPVNQEAPATGATTLLNEDPIRNPPLMTQPAPQHSVHARHRRGGKSWWGYVLLVIGILALSNVVGEALGIDIGSFIFPVLMIGAGVMLLRRR